ncbi:MAG: Wzz/FepE/Etk N-terminal domain-containing protein [Limnohabitans sp.]
MNEMNDAATDTTLPARENYSLMPILLPLAQAKLIVLGFPLLVSFLVLMHGVFSTPYYTASTRLLPPQYNQNTIGRGLITMGGESALGNSALNLKNPTDLFVGILRSRTILDGVITGNDLIKHYAAKDIDSARGSLASRTGIESGKDGIVEISVEDASAELAAQLANSYVKELQIFSGELAKREGGRRNEFFNTALNRARHSLNEADERLREVESKTGFTRLRGQDEAIVSGVRDLRSQLAEKEVQLRTLMSYSTESNPDVKLLKNEIANLNLKIQEISGLPAAIHKAPPGANAAVTLAQVPDALMLHSQRKRDVEYWVNIVTILGQYTELGKMDETRDFSLFQVLDVAVPPLDNSRPRVKLNLIVYGLGSSMLAVFFVWARAYVRQRRSTSDYFASQWVVLKAELLKMPWRRTK